MGTTINNLKKDLTGIHAGQVSPKILDSLKIDYYGNSTPVSQIANISTPEPQTLAISPWEKNLIKEIERSLQSANLGFSISNATSWYCAFLLPAFCSDVMMRLRMR